MGGDKHTVMPTRLRHGDQLVALVQRQGADTVVPQVLQGTDLQTLHRAVPGGHEQVQLLLGLLPEVEHGLHPLPRLHLKNVDDVDALGGLAALRDLIALLAVAAAAVGEEEDVVMGRGGKDGLDIVLVAQRRRAHALAAALLRGYFSPDQ